MMQLHRPQEDPVNELRRHMRLLQREIVRQLEDDTTCCGISLSQCHALMEIPSLGLSLKDLASTLGLDVSTLSRTIDGLVRAGLVERASDPTDRRAVRLTLSAAGQERVTSINAMCNKFYAALLEEMKPSDQRAVLRAVHLLVDVVRRLRQEWVKGPACCCTKKSGRSPSPEM